MAVKVKIRIGEIEIDYEGSEEFLKYELTNLINDLAQIEIVQNQILDVNSDEATASSANEDMPKPSFTNPTSLQMTTNNIVAKLGEKTGPGLAIAAALQLTLVQNRVTFKRQEILSEMQNATSYYKNSYGSNLSKSLERLVKDGVLIERNKDVYALHADHRSRLENKLGK